MVKIVGDERTHAGHVRRLSWSTFLCYAARLINISFIPITDLPSYNSFCFWSRGSVNFDVNFVP